MYFPIDLSLGEDWLFNLTYIDASANNKIAVVTTPLYNYVRGNNDSLDSKYRQDLLNICRRLNAECLAHLERWGVSQTQIEKLLQIIEKNPSATQAYYAEEIGVSKRTVSRMFVSLQEKGILVQSGTKRKANWTVIR